MRWLKAGYCLFARIMEEVGVELCSVPRMGLKVALLTYSVLLGTID